MSALPKTRMTAEEFVAWAEAQPGRYELVDGEVFAQASERVAHAKAKLAVALALQDAVRRAGAPCHVLPDGVAVRVDASTVFEPDAQLYCGPELPPDTLLVESPLIVVEVLSPSTGRNDVLGKLEGYFRIASVAHYLIFDPDSPLVIHHRRGQGGDILTRAIREGDITLDPPGLSFPLSAIYGEAR
ncbi:MAG TPA: Uma2 family endonuclease [Methylosinus sp.]|jgi:Uma2 family endonuclease|uniref:Uma2 family endonuclease n=1 Tax=Methylosinus sp. TaxID=427 RepID=UPI002F927C72